MKARGRGSCSWGVCLYDSHPLAPVSREMTTVGVGVGRRAGGLREFRIQSIRYLGFKKKKNV